MTTKDAFSDEEWVRVRRAPFVAGLAVSLADPGGPFELGKETMATLRSATSPPSREQLLAEVALELQAMTQKKENPLSGFKVDKQSQPGLQVLAELREVSGIVRSRRPPRSPRRSGSGCSPLPRLPPTPRRKAASWASVPCRSARGRRP